MLDSIQHQDPRSDDATEEISGTTPASRSAQFLAYIDQPEFPCVGAKAALARHAIVTHELGGIDDPRSDRMLLARIAAFGEMIGARDPEDTTVHSFAAIFSDRTVSSEAAFESQLWALLQRLHHLDALDGVEWADAISADPDSAKFSLSLGGVPFFVIGLHPGASRVARRYASAVLVFNSHHQFEELKENGRYQKMQAATRARDVQLQGSINPNLADFGAASESRQYSGRRVEPDWRCPFHVEVPH